MAGKKREVQLQVSMTYQQSLLGALALEDPLTAVSFLQAVVNTQSLWDEMLQNKGLTGTGVLLVVGPFGNLKPTLPPNLLVLRNLHLPTKSVKTCFICRVQRWDELLFQIL